MKNDDLIAEVLDGCERIVAAAIRRALSSTARRGYGGPLALPFALRMRDEHDRYEKCRRDSPRLPFPLVMALWLKPGAAAS